MTKTAPHLPPSLRAASLDELQAAAGGERPQLWSELAATTPEQRDELAAKLWRDGTTEFADASELRQFVEGVHVGAFGKPRRTEPQRAKGEATLSTCTLGDIEDAARLNAPLFAELRQADGPALDKLAARLFTNDEHARAQLGDRLALRGWLAALGARAVKP